jgi:hypothetical protein
VHYIKRVVYYADTVDLLVPYPIGRGVWRHLAASAKKAFSLPRKQNGVQVGDGLYYLRGGIYQLIRLQLPNSLAGLPQGSIRTRFDLAKDFVTGTWGEAESLGEVVQHGTCQKWHGRRRANIVDGTGYSHNRTFTSRNTTTYTDKPCKLTGEPCVHQELRHIGHKTLKRYGLDQVTDLANIDVSGVFDRQVRLVRYNDKKLDKVLRRMARSTDIAWLEGFISRFTIQEALERWPMLSVCLEQVQVMPVEWAQVPKTGKSDILIRP